LRQSTASGSRSLFAVASVEQLGRVRYLTGFQGREKRNDLVSIEEVADSVHELRELRGELGPLIADLHEKQQFLAHQISEGIVDSKALPDAFGGGALIDPDPVEF
jgi:hypothetical protein